MKLQLYKSALCPRCAYAAHIIKNLQTKYPDLEVETYDILTDLSAFVDNRVKMIPTIICGDEKASWLLPKEDEIKAFIQKNC